MAKTIFIADDHPIVLSGLVGLISSGTDYTVAGTASDGEMAIEGILRLRPSAVVLDLNMPLKNGIEVIRATTGVAPAILLAATLSPAEVYDAVAAGAAGLVLKEAAPGELISCLEAVCSGETWLPKEVMTDALSSETAKRERWKSALSTLTVREREIVALLLERHSNKQIAHLLGISEGTTKIHLNNIFRKFNVVSRAEVTALAP